MTNSINKKKFSNAWLIVVACMLIQAIPFGVASNIHPQFLKPIMDTEGFGLGAISLMFTFGTIISALFSPTIGKLFNKFPAKIIFTVGAIVSASGIFMLSIAGKQIVLFYLGYGIAQVGAATMSSIGIPVIMMSWFDDSLRGKATGLAFAGSGLGNIFLQQVAARLLSNPNYGYAKAYFIFGIFSLVVSLLISIFMVRLPKGPSELAANVPRKKAQQGENTKTTLTKWGYTLKEVTKMKLFWVLAVGFIFVGFYVSGMSVQYTSYLYKLGFSATYVANIGSIFAFFSILGNLCGGLFFDKLGIKKTLLLSSVMVVLCGISLVFIPGIPALGYLFAILLGITIFAYIIGPSYLTGALFGDREFGTILGIVQVFFAIGYALGTVLFGISVDTFGYLTSWIITTGYVVIAYACLLIASVGILKYNKENNVVETKKIV